MSEDYCVFVLKDDSLGDRLCLACGKSFEVGEKVVLVPLGPGDDPEERKKAAKGRAYNAVSIPVHLPCATGKDA